METATLADLVRCQVAVGSDPNRVGLVLDYRGDHPPLELLELLRRYGWLTPAPHAPPAKAIDWDHPDPDAGRRWTLRPFVVMGALAVPGPAAADWAATRGWLKSTLGGCGLTLADDQVEAGSLREPRQGLVDMVFDDVDVAVDPFKPATALLVPMSTFHPAVPITPIIPIVPTVPQGVASTAPAPQAMGRPAVDLVEAPAAPPSGLTPVHPPNDVSEGAGSPLMWTWVDPAVHQRTICAVVRRGVIGKVVELLHELDLENDTLLVPVLGHGRGGGRVTRYRGRESVEPLHRVQLQVAVDPALVEKVVGRIVEVSRVGEKGDGKVWVT